MRSQVGEDSSNRKFLVSRLFDVAEGSTLEESSSSCIRLEWNKGIVGHVAATGQSLNIKDAYEVQRLLASLMHKMSVSAYVLLIFGLWGTTRKNSGDESGGKNVSLW